MPHSTSWDDRTSTPPTEPHDTNNSYFTHRSSGIASPKSPSPTTSPTTEFAPTFSEHHHNIHIAGKCSCVAEDNSHLGRFRRRHSSQHSALAKQAIMASRDFTNHGNGIQEDDEQQERRRSVDERVDELRTELSRSLSKTTSPQFLPADASNANTPPFEHGASHTSAPRPAPQSSLRPGSLASAMRGSIPEVTGATIALNDTPSTTAPNSPRMRGDYFPNPTTTSIAAAEMERPMSLPMPMRQNSGTSTPRVRPTTLDIPGLTKSKVSPDGRIAQRDVGAKLVIVMVGLPARGKSYITKKLARYLNWLQHDTKIFNVGERRRVAAGGPLSLERTRTQQQKENGQPKEETATDAGQPRPPMPTIQTSSVRPASVAQIFLNDDTKLEAPATPQSSTTLQPPAGAVNGTDERGRHLSMPDLGEPKSPEARADNQAPDDNEAMEQNSAFFDPDNKKASLIREQVARETLDELLDYILDGNGSVGILDATNSTMERRKMVVDRIRERAGPDLNVLFLESRCVDQDLLEANMRLKLSGPDYRDMDPAKALDDFKKRVQVYEKAYVPLGDYEEKNNMPYIQMIDVGRKIISHQIRGFLSAQANYYLLNFNLAPRQIWITRHGLSMDNISGKIGGDSDLAPEGHMYARSLVRFMDEKRREWTLKQIENSKKTHFPPQPGDVTPPNPYYNPQSPTSERKSFVDELEAASRSRSNSGAASPAHSDPAVLAEEEIKPFCVWTSMLKRSIQTAQYFNDEEYDTKQMRMLDELNAGVMEGLTYSCISTQFPDEYRARKADKLHYRYPGPGGEGYLDIINRLRPVIVELERMTDHVLLVGHRSVARVLLAYFRGLAREEVADLDVPIGMLYCLEPKPYGVDFKVYKWDKRTEWFYEQPDFQLVRAEDDMQ